MSETAGKTPAQLKAERDGLDLAYTLIADEWRSVHAANLDNDDACWPTEQSRREQRYQDAGYEMGLRRGMSLMLAAEQERRCETEEWTAAAEGVYMAKLKDAPSWTLKSETWRLLHKIQRAAGDRGEDVVSEATAHEVCAGWQW